MREAAEAIGCDDLAAVGGYAGEARPTDRPDMGASDLASGTATYNADGTAATYTVAEGDARCDRRALLRRLRDAARRE